MILTMDSRTWDQKFTKNERADIVYNSQYAIMSTHIRKSAAEDKFDNIILMNNTIMPTIHVENSIDNITYRERYIEQLSDPEQLIYLCHYVEISLNYYPLIFIATPLEYNDLTYLNVLTEFIQQKFKCPVLDYAKYPGCLKSDIKFCNNSKIQKRIDKVLLKAIKSRHYKDVNTYEGNKKILSRAKNAPKKELKRILKKYDLWESDLSKEDMIERYMSFCIKDEPIL